MKYRGKKIITIVFICILSVAMCNITFAHSGRTDSKGGHKDKNNVSGLGSYHYHCGGYPAHLHTNGVCPYSSKTSKKSTKTTSKTTSSSSSTKGKSATTYSNSETKDNGSITIETEGIKINENIKEIEVGDSKQLSASILPENATNKEVIWETSDKDVIKVSSTGEITAIGEGKAYITVSTSNKKTDSIAILVTEEKKEVINNTLNIVTKQNRVNETSNTGFESANPIGTIITLGVLGGGGYLGYNKYKKGKK